MVTYQFSVDRETWDRWKETVPRTKTLDERLRELIEADAEGRVREPGEPAPTEPDRDDLAGHLDDLELPSTVDRSDAIVAIGAARAYLSEHEQATMRDFVTDVMPQYPLGYDVPDLEPGDRYRGAWWRKVVKPGLEALPGVEAPAEGGRSWRFTG
jgi:hypothetical protein